MHRVGSAVDLPPVHLRALVINAGTELATTLAVASLRRFAPNARILVIDARSTPPVSPYIANLADEWDFDVLELPLATHGDVLNALTDVMPHDELWMLFDSDAELHNPQWVDASAARFADPDVFGVGYEWGGNWLGEDHAPANVCWFRTKHWTGCVMFRASAIRAAREAGLSFRPKVVRNDFRWSQTVSRLLGLRFEGRVVNGGRFRRARRFLPSRFRTWLGQTRLPWLRWARGTVEGQRPNLIFDDTGGQIQEWCTAQGWRFVQLGSPPPDDGDPVRTWHPGLTTRLLREGVDGPSLVEPALRIRARLREQYAIEWDDTGIPAWSWPKAKPR